MRDCNTLEDKMTSEIEYYIALQPLFREKMGAWRVGDWLQDEELTGVVMAISDDTDLFVYFSDKCQRKLPHGLCHFLPLPIDPRNPERGLWGMVNWGRWTCSVSVSGSLLMECGYSISFEDTFNLALLKTLAVQEGIEI
jgi:hypothetical protein